MNDATDSPGSAAISTAARMLCHQACQWPSRAARANLPARDDDGHSNLGWAEDVSGLVSLPLDAAGTVRVGFRFELPALLWLIDDVQADQLLLADADEEDAQIWLDGHLIDFDLRPAAEVELPYEIETAPDYRAFDQLGDEAARLGDWYRIANAALERVVREFGQLSVTPASVRCWPHHFDIAVLLTLEAGNPETAPSVGVGLSPGDERYRAPYFYCSPWPAPDIASLPAAPEPFNWHTEGFVAMVAAATEFDPNPAADLDQSLRAAVSIARGIAQQT